MPGNYNEGIEKDIILLGKFVSLYCAGKHQEKAKREVQGAGKLVRYINPLGVRMCNDCAKLLLYAASKRLICPYDPKPACKDCETHCYAEPHRSEIRKVMRYSGMRMILWGSVSYIRKFF